MQVNSVSLANANSKPVFKGPREDLEDFAYMDEMNTRKLAMARTSKDVNDKKHRRISNALYLAAPLSGGLAAACSVPSKVLTKVGGVNVSRATRIAAGAAGAVRLGALFLGIDAIFALKNKIDNSNETMKEFSQKHPLMSFFGTVAASFAAFYGLKHGAVALSKKLPSSAKHPVKAVKSFLKFSEKLNNSKVLNKASEYMGKVPSSVKSLAKGVLNWGPVLFILGRFSHDVNHNRERVAAFQDNYNQIKGEQAVIRAALNVQDEVAAAVDAE